MSPCVSPLRSCVTSPRSLSPCPLALDGLGLPVNAPHTNTFDCYACYHSRLKTYEKSKHRFPARDSHFVDILMSIVQVGVAEPISALGSWIFLHWSSG